MADVLAPSRETQGLERLEEVRFATLETSCQISIVPRGQPC